MKAFPDFGPFTSETTSTLTESGNATLTLTRDGPVLGVPTDTAVDDQQEVARRVDKWLIEGGVLVLPWPVDVTDIR